MGHPRPRWWPAWTQVVVSGLVLVLGVASARELDRVDQNLRSMYTEHTLAAADLAHITADVMRYRTTVIRALDASTKEDFDRTVGSLALQRARIQMALDRYTTGSTPLGQRGRAEQDALRESLNAYFTASERTVTLLQRLRAAQSPAAAAALRQEAEGHIRDTAGAKLVAVSMALDRLLETVAEIGRGMQDDGIVVIRETSTGLIVGSVLLAVLNLWGRPVRRPGRPGPEAAPAPPASDPHRDPESLAR